MPELFSKLENGRERPGNSVTPYDKKEESNCGQTQHFLKIIMLGLPWYLSIGVALAICGPSKLPGLLALLGKVSTKFPHFKKLNTAFALEEMTNLEHLLISNWTKKN